MPLSSHLNLILPIIHLKLHDQNIITRLQSNKCLRKLFQLLPINDTIPILNGNLKDTNWHIKVETLLALIASILENNNFVIKLDKDLEKITRYICSLLEEPNPKTKNTTVEALVILNK